MNITPSLSYFRFFSQAVFFAMQSFVFGGGQPFSIAAYCIGFVPK